MLPERCHNKSNTLFHTANHASEAKRQTQIERQDPNKREQERDRNYVVMCNNIDSVIIVSQGSTIVIQ